MPGFFGDPYVAQYTGPTANDAISNILAGQQQGFAQTARKKLDTQQGRFWDDKTQNQFEQAAQSGMSISPDDGLAPTAGLLQTHAGAPTQGAPTAPPMGAAPGGMMQAMRGNSTQADVTGSMGNTTPGGTVGAPGLGRRPIAGEMLPFAGRFATTTDGQQHDQAQATAQAGPMSPTAGLLATRAGQRPSVGAAAQQAGTPGAYQMPGVSITGHRPPQATAAAATPAAVSGAAAPAAPAFSTPSFQAPDLSGARLSPADAAAMSPTVPQFLHDQGIPLSVRMKGGGGVSYATPLLDPAYQARAAALRTVGEQNAQTGRTGITEQGENARAGATITGANERSASEQGTQRDIAAQGRASQERIAAQTYDLRKLELNKQLEQMEVMFGFKKDQQTQKAMDDITKGASKEEDQLTAADDAIKMLQLAKTNPSLGTGAQMRQFMVSNGINSARVSEALDHMSETGMDPSVGGRISRFLSGAADGVPPAEQLDAATKAMQQVRGSLFQTYDRKLMAGARQHTEVPDAMQRIRVRQMTIAPDLVQGAGGAGGGTAAAGGGAGGAGGALRPVSQSEWDTIKKSHNLSDGQMAKYYSVGSPRG